MAVSVNWESRTLGITWWWGKTKESKLAKPDQVWWRQLGSYSARWPPARSRREVASLRSSWEVSLRVRVQSGRVHGQAWLWWSWRRADLQHNSGRDWWPRAEVKWGPWAMGRGCGATQPGLLKPISALRALISIWDSGWSVIWEQE